MHVILQIMYGPLRLDSHLIDLRHQPKEVPVIEIDIQPKVNPEKPKPPKPRKKKQPSNPRNPTRENRS